MKPVQVQATRQCVQTTYKQVTCDYQVPVRWSTQHPVYQQHRATSATRSSGP